MKRVHKKSQEGYTYIEVLIVMAVLLIVSQSVRIFLDFAVTQTQGYRDKIQATARAVQMMEELRATVLDNTADITVLDAYKDTITAGVPAYYYTLTTNTDIFAPKAPPYGADDFSKAADPLSNNPKNGVQGYRFARRIEVDQVNGDKSMRRVTVRVFLVKPNPGNGAASVPVLASQQPLAEVSTTIRSSALSTTSNQVMDLYLIALETSPGWWSRTSNLIPLMNSAITSLQARNPGLVVRSHWVKRMSYGRDKEYTPETNQATRADSYNFAKTYVYPGLIHYDDPIDDYYYDPTYFSARVNNEGTIDANDGYAIADMWNHAVRYQEELDIYNVHKAVIQNNPSAATPEISLRMLLEGLNSQNPAYLNSIVINLHGEMFPVLPLRNVSDAAKDPKYFWNDRPTAVTWTVKTARAFRAVTHPERLHFTSATDEEAVRVYAYDAAPPADPITTALENDPIDIVTLFIPGADTSNINHLDRLQGGANDPYHWHTYNVGNWQTSGSTLYDGLAPNDQFSHFVADNYTNTTTGRSGLRIRLYGVSATARSYDGKSAYTGVVR